ncbi:MAG: hypothetical protein QNK04_17470 [Myxococcota bacterium]|nr:hypothetical protein [Myxococcota bacterium]
MAHRPPRVLVLAACLVLASPALAESDEELEVVELIPEDRAGVGSAQVFAPITGLFLGGPGHWYGERTVRIETTPPGAFLDLFYVRRNFQKGYEQAEAPVIVQLPKRIEAGNKDSLRVRAFLDGYQQKEVSLRIHDKTEELFIELDPLANSLVGLTHLYLAGRSSLSFQTKEALTFRVQKRNSDYSLVLLETAATPDANASMAAVTDGLVSSLSPQQLGEDLVVKIALTAAARAGEVDVRQRQDFDPIRRVHAFTVDVSTRDGPSSVQRARAALERIGPAVVSDCSMRFDDELRGRLEPSELARALTPRGAFQDPYLRAALKRLGEVSPGGQVTLLDGTKYQTSQPLELAAASSQAAEVRGYLSMLRRFVAELEAEPYRRATLRGLVAPSLTPADFDRMMDAAEAAEGGCRTSA